MLKALFFRLLFCFCDLKAHTRKILSQGGKKKKDFPSRSKSKFKPPTKH